MSYNQSRSDNQSYRKSGRSGTSNYNNQQHQQRNPSVSAYGRGGDGGPPPPSSIYTNRSGSFKKSNNNNPQGGQTRVNPQPVNSVADSSNASAPPRNLQNGAPVQLPLSRGASDPPVTSGVTKPTEAPAPAQRVNRAVPKSPTSQSAVGISESATPTTPAKGSADTPKPFQFQFGSISPGVMNGMQIPARTSSAPPNLDEQKRDQARHEALRSVPPVPAPAPRPQLPSKDANPVDQSSIGEMHPGPKPRKDPQVSPAPPMNETQKPAIFSVPRTSMQMQFPQAPMPVQLAPGQFVSPSSQIHPQGVAAGSHQMPMHMPLPMGNAPQLQQQMFVPPHLLQSPGLVHQGQSLGFTAPIVPQPPPQFGMGITPQYHQQPGGKLGNQRKTTVKITDPKTHEELRLDKRTDAHTESGSSGLKSNPQLSAQSQAVPSFGHPHTPINYYTGGYGAGGVYYGAQGSLPLTGSHITPSPQPPRFGYPGSQGRQNVSIANPPPANPLPTGSVQVTVKLASGSTREKQVDSQVSNTLRSSETDVSNKPGKVSVEVSPSHHQDGPEIGAKPGIESPVSKSLSETNNQPVEVTAGAVASNSLASCLPDQPEEPVPVMPNSDRRDILSRSNSIKEHHKNPAKKGQVQPQDQAGGQSASVSSVALGTPQHAPTKITESPVGSSDVSEVLFDSSAGVGHDAELAEISIQENLRHDILGIQAPGQVQSKDEVNSLDTLNPITSVSADPAEQAPDESASTATALGNEVPASGTAKDEPVTCQADNVEVPDNSPLQSLGSPDVNFHGDNTTTILDSSSSKSERVEKSDVLDEQFAPVQSDDLSDTASKHEADSAEDTGGGSLSVTSSNLKEKPAELTRTKSTTSKFKKKRKEILQKADAAGTTSDLYMAYKGPEEKKEDTTSSVVEDVFTAPTSEETAVDSRASTAESVKEVLNKTEVDDWEDAADISTPKLETPTVQNNTDGNESTSKRYSRDFLLKFSEQCIDLPEGFEITSDIADALMSTKVAQVGDHDLHSSARVMDKSNNVSRIDRRGSGIVDDRWNNKLSASFGPGRNLNLDIGYGGNVAFQPGQGANFGVLRIPRAQIPVQYAGGILSGPMQSMGPHGGIQRNNSDADRWQRATYFQKGLIPSPQTPSQSMHKAERKYEVGKVADEEESKQRQLKAILNKLTPQNFEKLFEQVKAVDIDNAVTLTGVISQIFDKALMEPTFCEMYANFCYHLAGELPDFTKDNEKITFKRLLLNKCQEEFQRGEREQEEANKVEEEGEIRQTDAEREEKRTKARRRMLGNIRLIGELYKKKMLTERIMHECIQTLLGEYQNPDEENVEALCKLMSTIGEMIDHAIAKDHMDAYFERMSLLSNNMNLSSRVRFMLKDAIDLRKNKWQQRRKVEGPKKIEEVHRDAVQERMQQTIRPTRNQSMNLSARRAPMDFGSRGSPMLSPHTPMGSFRGIAPQVRGYGIQDVRFEERQPYEARTLPVTLPQRPLEDDSITLGPQGGLARGMSGRGPSATSSNAGLNGFTSAPERPNYSPREDLVPRYLPDRLPTQATSDELNSQDRVNFGGRDLQIVDRGFDRSLDTSPSAQGQGPPLSQNAASENVWLDERLRDKSMAAIKEYYSARDEKEVALCIKELNAASYHPSMVSLWVNDSFERKDMERDLLAKLIVNIARSRDGILTPPQLIKGFEYVLSTLEDAVNDAPRATEFLGRIFAKAITENVVALRDIGKLLYDGGVEPGDLRDAGLAGDVLGSTLEAIKTDNGEKVLKDILAGSSLRLEDFRPPNPLKSRMLEKFI